MRDICHSRDTCHRHSKLLLESADTNRMDEEVLPTKIYAKTIFTAGLVVFFTLRNKGEPIKKKNPKN